MDFPDEMLARVAGYLLPQFAVRFRNAPVDHLYDRRTIWELVAKGRYYTYSCWASRVKLPGVASTLSQIPSFLYVNPRLYDLGVPLLYDKDFFLLSSYELCLAFLHDHQKQEHAIRRIGLTYLGSSSEAFRNLVDVLIHERPELEEIQLQVRREFWGSRSPLRRLQLSESPLALQAWIPSSDNWYGCP